MKIAAYGVACVLLSSMSAPAFAQNATAPQPDRKTITIANAPLYPPMEFKDTKTGKLVGIDIDIGEALGKRLGLTLKWEEIGFEQQLNSLATGRVDMIMSGMFDLPSRRETLDFVNYLTSGAQFYTRADRAAEIKSESDLCGKSVGSSRRTTFPAEIAKWSAAHCEAAGKPAIKIVGTEGSADARTQLRQGRIDAAAQGSETVPYMLQTEPNTFITVGKPFTEALLGMAFTKKDAALRDGIAGALKDIMADGTYKAILAKWGMEANAIPVPMVNSKPLN